MTNVKLNYQQLSAKLDEVLYKLQQADIDVDEALELYKEGIELSKLCEEYLKQAENKLSKLAQGAKLS